MAFVKLSGGIAYKMYRQSSRQWSLLEIAEEGEPFS